VGAAVSVGGGASARHRAPLDRGERPIPLIVENRLNRLMAERQERLEKLRGILEGDE
jgi:hypothetical protein